MNFLHDIMHECKGDTGYDPACKYDYSFKVLMHDINEITCQSELDQCWDETFMGHTGHTESGSGISSRIMNNTGITKA